MGGAKEAKPQAPVGGAKEAKPQAPKEAAKEAKPQATKKAKEKEQWLRPGVAIPSYEAESDDSSSGGHSATFSAGEIGEMTDVELEAYKTGGPPPTDATEWDIPRDLGIAPVGRSRQNRQWRRTYREQYRTGAANVARGMVDEEGTPVKFHVTTDTTPTAYYYVEGKRTTWEVEEFHWLQEWLRQQEDAPEAEAEAEKGHAADQPSGGETVQEEKGHAGDKATQGSGESTQKLWSAPDPPRRRRPARPWANQSWVTRARTFWRSGRTSRTRLLTEYVREGQGADPGARLTDGQRGDAQKDAGKKGRGQEDLRWPEAAVQEASSGE